jgi:hypothetical protein
MITLPTEPIVSTRNDPRLMLLYGPPKIGKTTILSQLPQGKYIIEETDPRGCEYITASFVQLNSMADYVEAETLIKKRTPRYDFVAIDTIDNLESWSVIVATRLYKSSPIGKTFNGESVLELPNGGGYMYLRQVFTNCIMRALDLAPQVIFVGHIRDKLIGQTAGQEEVYSADLDLTGKIKAIVCSMVDCIGYVNRDKDSNIVVNFKTRADVVCGTRCPHLKGRNFTMKGSAFDWSVIYPDYYAKMKGQTV